MAYQAVDQKKEDFRRYLEKNGVIDSLTKALVGLYEENEKPSNPMDYMRSLLQEESKQTGSGPQEDAETVRLLREENEKLKATVAQLEAKIAALETASASPSPAVTSAPHEEEQHSEQSFVSPTGAE